MKLIIYLLLFSSQILYADFQEFIENPIDYTVSNNASSTVKLNHHTDYSLTKLNKQTVLSDHEFDQLLSKPHLIDYYKSNVLYDPPHIALKTKQKMDLMHQVFNNEGCRFIAQLEDNEASQELRNYALKYINAKDDYELTKQPVPTLESDFELQRRKKEYFETVEKTQDFLKREYQSILKEIEDNTFFKRHPEAQEKTLNQIGDYENFLKHLKKPGGITSWRISTKLERLRESKPFGDYDFAKENYYPYLEGVKEGIRANKKFRIHAIARYRKIIKDPKLKDILERRKFTEKELRKLANQEELRLLDQSSVYNKNGEYAPIYKKPRNIVISFEGTANYSPIKEKQIKVLNALAGRNPSQKRLKQIDKFLDDNHKDKNVYNGNKTWPGLLNNQINRIITQTSESRIGTSDLVNRRDTQWLYFPSEMQGDARAIAMNCLESYLSGRDKGDKPSVTILGHSSGAYSAMQFSKELQDKGIEANLLSIDPILPAHKAGLSVLATKGLDSLPLVPERKCEDKYYQADTDDLKFETTPRKYKSYLNFYQKQDIIGFGDGNEWGLRGNRVKNMKNKQIYYNDKFIKEYSPHGAIASEPQVLRAFYKMLD